METMVEKVGIAKRIDTLHIDVTKTNDDYSVDEVLDTSINEVPS